MRHFLFNARIHHLFYLTSILWVAIALAGSGVLAVEQEPVAHPAVDLTQEVRAIQDQLELANKALAETTEQLENARQENAKLRSALDGRAPTVKPAHDIPADADNPVKKKNLLSNQAVCEGKKKFYDALSDKGSLYNSGLPVMEKRKEFLKLASEYDRAVTNKTIVLTAHIANVKYSPERKTAAIYSKNCVIESGDPDIPNITYGEIRTLIVPMTEAAAVQLNIGDTIELSGSVRTDMDFSKDLKDQPAFFREGQGTMPGYVLLHGNLNTTGNPLLCISQKASLKIAGVNKRWE